MEHFMLVCGKWKFERNRWDFVVDANRGARMLLAEDCLRLDNLIAIVFEDYGVDETENDVKLSYMLRKDVMQNLPRDTPPVYISNCRQLQVFVGQARGSCPRLCVEFLHSRSHQEVHTKEDSDEEDDSRFDYCDDSDGTSSDDEKFEDFGCVDEEVIEDVENLNLPPKKRSVEVYVSEGNVSERVDLNNLDLAVGQSYDTKELLLTRMKILSVLQKFDFDVHKSTTMLLTAKCWVNGCSWKVRATPIGDSTKFHVRQYVPKHTCSVTDRAARSQQATHENTLLFLRVYHRVFLLLLLLLVFLLFLVFLLVIRLRTLVIQNTFLRTFFVSSQQPGTNSS